MAATRSPQHVYKTKGRGRGILGLKEYVPCRRPGCVADENVNSGINNNTDTSGANAMTSLCCVKYSNCHNGMSK